MKKIYSHPNPQRTIIKGSSMFKSKITSLLNFSFLFLLLHITKSVAFNDPSQEIKDELLKKIDADIPEWMAKQIEADFADIPESE